MPRAHNFNPGPSVLPLAALEKAREALTDLQGLGVGIMEISHRSPPFEAILERAKERLTRLLSIPPEYAIFFCQGGARTQFGMLPMNFLHTAAGYTDTGHWAANAIEEAQLCGRVRITTSSREDNYTFIPAFSKEMLAGDEDYLHITTNNTMYGIQWNHDPDAGSIPLVADMSSDIASRPVDVRRYAMIYAGAQKNIGPAGVTVVIIHPEFLKRAKASHLPAMFRYETFVKHNSLYNTPPVWNIYLTELVLEWLESIGGIHAVESRNRQKAALIYDLIDAHPDFYRGHARPDSRSVMNITLRLPNADLEKRFLAEADKLHILGIKGHRAVGGIRISNYNALPLESMEVLASWMKHFLATQG